MKYRDCMIAWTPDDVARRKYDAMAGCVEVGPHPDLTGWSQKYECTTGGCYADVRDSTPDRQVIFMLADFQKLIVGYGLDPMRVHEAFLQIDEYRDVIKRR